MHIPIPYKSDHTSKEIRKNYFFGNKNAKTGMDDPFFGNANNFTKHLLLKGQLNYDLIGHVKLLK